jgi:hypothetical protein
MGKEINKLANARLLAENEDVAPHLPEYHRCSRETIRSMLRKYSVVYAKPINSCQGKGVMRVERVAHGYVLKPRDYNRTYRLRTLGALYQTIQRLKMPRTYLLQQGIASYTVNGRLFDIRTHLLRIDGQWELGAIIGRVATARGVATNAYSGGKPVPILQLLREYLGYDQHQQDQCIKELTNLSLAATETFSAAFPRWPEVGLDIGIDEEGQLWIYEINIKPGMLVFRDDRPSFERIMEMKKLCS